jgi:hypothetical protein
MLITLGMDIAFLKHLSATLERKTQDVFSGMPDKVETPRNRKDVNTVIPDQQHRRQQERQQQQVDNSSRENRVRRLSTIGLPATAETLHCSSSIIFRNNRNANNTRNVNKGENFNNLEKPTISRNETT